MIRDVYSGYGFFSFPDPGVKKTPEDPGSRSARMISTMMCITVQVTLSNNEGVTVLELDPVQAVFPLSLSFNFCVVTPLVLAPHPGLHSDGN